MRLLHEEGFEGPLEEFMSAHEHYRKGETKDANVDALNALESTLKAICDKRKWKRSPSAQGADLIRVVVNHGLIPAELQGHFDHLIKAMEKGLPPIRHNYGGPWARGGREGRRRASRRLLVALDGCEHHPFDRGRASA